MGEIPDDELGVSDEGLEQRLSNIIFELNNNPGDFMPLTSVYIDAIKNEGWVPGTHVSRARALMEDAQRELAKEKKKNTELEERIKELESRNEPPKITITTNSIDAGAISTGDLAAITFKRLAGGSVWGGLA